MRLFVVNESERVRALASGPAAAAARAAADLARQAGSWRIGLYLDDSALANLENNDPNRGLGDHNFADFCLAVEGVSHFIYVALCAAANRQVTALELELQAEVDKFVSCLLLDEAASRRPTELRARLYEKFHLAEAPRRRGARPLRRPPTSRPTATPAPSSAATRDPARLHEMLAELRQFYRLPLEAKLAHIARAAA